MKTRMNWILAGVLWSALSSAAANAALVTAGYVGKMDDASGIRVFVKAQNGESDSGFGLIVFEQNSKGYAQAGLFRIEELADGTQSWIPLYQGQGNYLRTNADQMPALKGHLLQSGSKQTLRLVPANGSSTCSQIKEIVADPSKSDNWVEFPAQETRFEKGAQGSTGVLKGSLFSGSINFSSTSNDGTFAFGAVAPGLSGVRAQVLDPKSISGWSLARELLAAAVPVARKSTWGSSKNELVLVGLPQGQERCMNESIILTGK